MTNNSTAKTTFYSFINDIVLFFFLLRLRLVLSEDQQDKRKEGLKSVDFG